MRAVLSLGSNLGDRLASLRLGVELVGAGQVSSVYETSPVDVDASQPDYLNCVAIVDVTDADEALARAHRAEDTVGRLRTAHRSSRRLDVDVVSVDAIVSDDPRLTLPHPRAYERAFVLVPWHEVDPDAIVPGRGPVWRLLRRLDTSGVHRIGALR